MDNSKKLIVKISSDSLLRRISFNDITTVNYANLVSRTAQVFQVPERLVRLFAMDEQGDEVSISNNTQLLAVINQYSQESGSTTLDSTGTVHYTIRLHMALSQNAPPSEKSPVLSSEILASPRDDSPAATFINEPMEANKTVAVNSPLPAYNSVNKPNEPQTVTPAPTLVNLQQFRQEATQHLASLGSTVERQVEQLRIQFAKMQVGLPQQLSVLESIAADIREQSQQIGDRAQTLASAVRSAVINMGQTRDLLHPNVQCDVCIGPVYGNRWKCENCRDYDMCNTCYAERRQIHPSFHTFKKHDPPKVSSSMDESIRSSTNLGPSPIPSEVPSEHPPVETVRHRARCNFCDSHIEGVRWKCLDCPDFDLCASCSSLAAIEHPRHAFVTIKATEDIIGEMNQDLPVHKGVICDGCQGEIRGIRYKCGNCSDFDLCGNCEASPLRSHNKTHVMIKLPLPVPIMYTRSPLLPNIYESNDPPASIGLFPTNRKGVTASSSPLVAKSPQPMRVASPLVNTRPSVRSNSSRRSVEPPPRSSSRHQKQQEYQNRSVSLGSPLSPLNISERRRQSLEVGTTQINESMNDLQHAHSFPDTMSERESVSQTLESTSVVKSPPFAPTAVPGSWPTALESQLITPESSADTTKALPFQAIFVNDLTIPDGSQLSPGERFTKCWLIENTGSTAWPEDVVLQWAGGVLMVGNEYQDTQEIKFPVPVAGAGERVVIEAELLAPQEEGRHISYWRLKRTNGEYFGDRVWCEILVSATAVEEEENMLASSTLKFPKIKTSENQTDTESIITTTTTGVPGMVVGMSGGGSQSKSTVVSSKEENAVKTLSSEFVMIDTDESEGEETL